LSTLQSRRMGELSDYRPGMSGLVFILNPHGLNSSSIAGGYGRANWFVLGPTFLS